MQAFLEESGVCECSLQGHEDTLLMTEQPDALASEELPVTLPFSSQSSTMKTVKPACKLCNLVVSCEK